MKAIVLFLGFVYECLLTDSTIALQCGIRRSDCCSGYIYDKDKATCVECPAGYHGPHCIESCPFPSYGVLCRLRCTCFIGYCHNEYGCYIKKTTGMASTITSSPKRNILATLKNNNPNNETSMSTLVSKMTGVLGTEFHGSHILNCQRCAYPRYGDECKQRCICKPYLCSHIKGCQLQDRCPVGFIGKNCDKQCSYPQYGIGCQKSCMCSKQRCNGFTGCQFTKTVNKNHKPHQTNPVSSDVSNSHTTKIVEDVSRESRNQTSITPVIPGLVSEDRSTTRFENTDFTEQDKISAGTNKTELTGEPIQQLGVNDKINKELNANLHDFLRERKLVKLCIVLFGIMVFLLLIAHIVLSIIQCPSGNRK